MQIVLLDYSRYFQAHGNHFTTEWKRIKVKSWVPQWFSWKTQKLLFAARFDPGTSRAGGKRTCPLRPVYIQVSYISVCI